MPTDDFTAWVEPYLTQIDKVRQVLMTPYVLAPNNYGYDPGFGLVRGGNIEPSPAIGVTASNEDVIVLIDNNLEGSASLDFWNSYSGVTTTVEANCRGYLAKTFDEISSNCPPFPTTTYNGTDRREAKYGSHSPYYAQLSQPGAKIYQTAGQTDYVQGFEGLNAAHASCSNPPTLSTNMANPLIVSALPVGSAIGSGGNLETDGPWIDLQFEQGSVAAAQAEFTRVVQAWNGTGFGTTYGSATRDLLHFIEAARATGFWRDATITGPQGTAQQVLQQVINVIWQNAGPGGGLSQEPPGGSYDTPEPNFQALIAFDPRVPTWF